MAATRDITHGLGVSIDVQSAYKVFDGNVQAVHDVSCSVAAGEFASLLGPSGCGKSTLLRMIAGLERCTSGEIRIGSSRVIPGERRSGVAFVFQDAHLLPWRSVLRNVELPLELLGISKGERRDLTLHAIEEVGLADAANRYPAQLSGGMRMRVSLARALVSRPRLLLLDEPFAALDELTRQRLDEQLLSLWQHTGMTVLFVTHSIAEAVFLSQRALVVSRRPSRLLADVKIDIGPERTPDTRTQEPFAKSVREIQRVMRGQEDD